MTSETAQRRIEQFEERRSLMASGTGIGSQEMREIQFYEWSPGRVIVTLWSLETGEEVHLPNYQAEAALATNRWTPFQDKAPKPRVMNTLCLFHRNAPNRALLDEVGIQARCESSHLDGLVAQMAHAETKHKDSWKRWQSYLAEQRRQEEQSRQERQTEAILALAGARAAPKPARVASVVESEPTDPCSECGFVAKSEFGMKAHMRKHAN